MRTVLNRVAFNQPFHGAKMEPLARNLCMVEQTEIRAVGDNGSIPHLQCGGDGSSPSRSTKIQSKYTQRYGEYSRNLSRERTRRNRDALFEYKRSHGCKFCPEREPICLDLHHLDPSKKDFQISTGLNRNWDTILEEVSKCIVLCSNCHRKVHAGILVIPE